MKFIGRPLLWIYLMLLFLPFTAHATLWDRGNGLIYDDLLDITWLQDANLAMTSGYDDDGLMTSVEAFAWADNLVFEGYDDWRLPDAYSTDGAPPDYGWNEDEHEMGFMYYHTLGNTATMVISDYSGLLEVGPFVNLQPFRYWTNTPYDLPGFWWYFNFGNGFQWDGVDGITGYAWAVRDGDIESAPVPEPSSLSLMLVVAMAFATQTYRRRFTKV